VQRGRRGYAWVQASSDGLGTGRRELSVEVLRQQRSWHMADVNRAVRKRKLTQCSVILRIRGCAKC
jgi:hypothetical protein